ncbi:MAG: hypothetical protein HRU19_09025 [Pseudobacteriovorax sp.]|nr:hypothetical protein [Pseudobacteriovorax sp.]
MGASARSTEDPGAVAFFVSNLCSEADLVYRFGYTVLLNEEQAKKLVIATFARVTKLINEFLNLESQDIRFKLLSLAWENLLEFTDKSNPEKPGLVASLQKLSEDCRLVLVTVDILGMSPRETERILKMKPVEVRRYLADGRQQLLLSMK